VNTGDANISFTPLVDSTEEVFYGLKRIGRVDADAQHVGARDVKR
jgi:hypothetical protein